MPKVRKHSRQVFRKVGGRKIGVYPEGRYYRERQFEPSECQPRTTRTKKAGSHRLVLCRKKGQKKVSLQSVLHPRTPKERRKLGLSRDA